MRNRILFFVLLAFCASNLFASGNSGLILPMPGQSVNQPTKSSNPARSNGGYNHSSVNSTTTTTTTTTSAKTTKSYNSGWQTIESSQSSQEQQYGATTRQKRNGAAKTIDPNRVFIPLPPAGQRSKPQPPKVKEAKKSANVHVNPETQALIQLPVKTEPEDISNDNLNAYQAEPEVSDIPKANYSDSSMDSSDDLSMPSENIANVDNKSNPEIEPPIITTETPQVVSTEGSGSITVFPKDTSSAAFMVMKSWQCEDYDASTLLEHAVSVYSQEADDVFQIVGLPGEADSYTVTLEEEDITLDELIDIVAQKAGRDWGVDMSTKTIHFYPAGVTQAAEDAW